MKPDVRLVLDTNTVVSGLLWDGPPSLLLDVAKQGDIDLYSSRALLGELARVLVRRKFFAPIGRTGVSLDELIEGYAELAFLVTPASIGSVVATDPDDDHVIACALAAQADLIVSGDSDLLQFKRYHDIPIVTPTEALTRLRKK